MSDKRYQGGFKIGAARINTIIRSSPASHRRSCCFSPPTGPDHVVVFSVWPLAEYSRITCSDAVFRLLTFINEFDLVCEDPYGALPETDIASVEPSAAGEVHFHFVSLNPRALVAV